MAVIVVFMLAPAATNRLQPAAHLREHRLLVLGLGAVGEKRAQVLPREEPATARFDHLADERAEDLDGFGRIGKRGGEAVYYRRSRSRYC